MTRLLCNLVFLICIYVLILPKRVEFLSIFSEQLNVVVVSLFALVKLVYFIKHVACFHRFNEIKSIHLFFFYP